MQPKSNTTHSEPQPASGGAATPRAPKSDRRKRNIPVATDRRHLKPEPSGDGEATSEALARDRRKRDIPAAVDSRKSEVSEPVAAPFVSAEESAFKQAMDRYKRENRRPFPTWSEVLEVLRSLGYRKVAEESQLPAGPPVKG